MPVKELGRRDRLIRDDGPGTGGGSSLPRWTTSLRLGLGERSRRPRL